MDRAVTRLDPQPPRFSDLFEKWKQHAHQHPVVAYMQETGDGSAHQITDFLSRPQFHALELYRECFREMDVEYQMSVAVTTPKNIMVGVGLNRRASPFSETERQMANLLRPHVSEAYLTLVELGHLRGMVDGFGAAFDDTGEGIVFWSHKGVLLQASPQARQILENCFGWRGGQPLPEEIVAWARDCAGNLEIARTRRVIREEAGRRVVVRQARPSASHYLTILIREESLVLEPVSLLSLGISMREAEVLSWLAAGKSNSEIAAILGVSPLTIKTHVLNILRKLGVENRTTAAARAHDLAMSVPPKRPEQS